MQFRAVKRWLIAFIVISLIPTQTGKANVPSSFFDSGPDLALYPLLYRRDGAKSAAQIVMVGDVSMARGVSDGIVRHGDDYDYPLSQVAAWLKSADLVVGNYEGVIAADGVGAERPKGYRLRALPEAALALAKAGFGLVSLANNHTMDWGAEGLKATIDALHGANIKTVGAGNGASADDPVITTINGVRIAWVAYNAVQQPDDDFQQETRGYGRANLDEGKLAAQIKAAHRNADMVIVQFHGGVEYQTEPTTKQVRLARAAIDAGAVLVVGHHPHVMQTIEEYHGKLIVYSLGNFLFDQDQKPGLALWVRIDRQGVIDVHGLTVKPGIRPVWATPSRAAADVRDSCGQAGSVEINYGGLRKAVGAEVPMAEKQSTLDMRGDGQQEHVTLKNGTLRILDGDQVVYESYPDWQTVDFAVGDPNEDGRYEVLALFWKQDKAGDPVTTHPFIIGYRQGVYKTIWGGSATANWVQALGIADVDGDHLDDLITIERNNGATICAAAYHVVVMKWNGWGFTQEWRSEAGSYAEVGISAETASQIVVTTFR